MLGGSASGQGGPQGRGRSLSRSALDATKRARMEHPLARPAEAGAVAGAALASGAAVSHRNRQAAGLDSRAAVEAFRAQWGFADAPVAAAVPMGAAEAAVGLEGVTQSAPATHRDFAPAHPAADLGAASAGLEVPLALAAGNQATPGVGVPGARGAEEAGAGHADHEPHWREGGWSKSNEPREPEPEWWSGSWHGSPTRWGEDLAEGHDRAAGSGSSWAAADVSGDAAGPAAVARGPGVP